MLHVNDDNNDELFRKAAENFFLRSDNPDWEAFMNKTNSNIFPSGQEAVTAKDKKTYRLFSLIFAWLRNKAIYCKSSFFSRIAKFSVWSGKTKKKINPVFC